MNEFTKVSIIVFLLVVYVEVALVTIPENMITLGLNNEVIDPDLLYYSFTGSFGTGHDLTLLFSKPLAQIHINLMPIFFTCFYAVGCYYLMSTFIKNASWVFVLTPLIPLTVILAQVFSIGIFWFTLGFYFRAKLTDKKVLYNCLVGVGVILMILAHFWGGLFLTVLFALYILIDNDGKLVHLSIVSLFAFVIATIIYKFNPIPMLNMRMIHPTTLVENIIFLIIKGNIGLWFCSLIGLKLLYERREYSLVKISVLLFIIPVITILFFNFDWAYRTFYFIPLVPLSTILFSDVIPHHLATSDMTPRHYRYNQDSL